MNMIKNNTTEKKGATKNADTLQRDYVETNRELYQKARQE